MMMTRLLLTFVALLWFTCDHLQAQNIVPQIENLTYFNDQESGELVIDFNTLDPDNDSVVVTIQVRQGARTKMLFPNNLEGDVGPQKVDGNKTIIWNYSSDFENILDFDVKLMIDDGEKVDIKEMVDQVSQTNLETWLDFIAKPRSLEYAPVHLDAVRDTIFDYFVEQNLIASLQPFNILFNDAANVLGEKTGHVNPEKIYVIDAHFDGKDDKPGADDNATGTAGVLEAARILSQYNFKNSIYFIGFDQEEVLLTGSRSFVDFGGRRPWEEYQGVLNLEMIGYYSEEENSQEVPVGFDLIFPEVYEEQQANGFKGDFILSVANGISDNLNVKYIEALNTYTPDLKNLGITLPDNLGILAFNFYRSDHASFWSAQIPALMITDGSEFRNHNYHTFNDVIETIDFPFMTNVVKGTIAALATLAEPIHSSEYNFRVEEQVVSGITVEETDCKFDYDFDQGTGFLTLKYPDCVSRTAPETVTIYNSAGQELYRENYNFQGKQTFTIEEIGVFIVVLEGKGRILRQKVTSH